MKRVWAIAVLSMPLLVFVLAVVNAERHLSTGEVYRFAITGYDPRDLLRGRYLQFRLAFDWQDQGATTCQDAALSQDCCLCLIANKDGTDNTGDAPPKVAYIKCEEPRDHCDDVLQQRALQDLNRFYVPEESARKAEVLLVEAQREGTAFVSVSVTRDGSAQLVDLEINGKPIGDLLSAE